MWKSAFVGVYQLLNWKMHSETLKKSSWEITLVDIGFMCISVTGIYREAREGVCSETRGKISHSESPWPHPTPRCDRRPGTAAFCGRSLQHALTYEIPEVN